MTAVLSCVPAKAGTQTREALNKALSGLTGLLPSQEHML